MLVSEAIAECIKRIDAEEERKVQAMAEAEANAEVKRLEFIAALRERIESQYGLELTDAEVAEWDVKKMSGDLYEMKWAAPQGSVMLSANLNIEEVSTGPDSVAIGWSAYHAMARWTASYENLIPALVFARTGKHL
jgi:hypothetical protein